MNRLLILGLGCAVALCCSITGLAAPPRPTPAKMPQTLRERAPATVLVKDIALSEISVDSQTCRVWVTWKNVGTIKIDASLKERVEVHSQPPYITQETNHVVLDPGKSYSHAVGSGSGGVIQGPTEVQAVIDVDNVLKESPARRANNSVYRTVNCGQTQPDLYASTIHFELKQTTTDAQGHTCKIVHLRPVVLNIGTAAVVVPFKVKVEGDKGPNRDWEKVYETSVPGIGAGETLTLTGTDTDTCLWYLDNPQMPANPTYRFRLTVDSAGNVPESQEGNNQNVSIY